MFLRLTQSSGEGGDVVINSDHITKFSPYREGSSINVILGPTTPIHVSESFEEICVILKASSGKKQSEYGGFSPRD